MVIEEDIKKDNLHKEASELKELFSKFVPLIEDILPQKLALEEKLKFKDNKLDLSELKIKSLKTKNKSMKNTIALQDEKINDLTKICKSNRVEIEDLKNEVKSFRTEIIQWRQDIAYIIKRDEKIILDIDKFRDDISEIKAILLSLKK